MYLPLLRWGCLAISAVSMLKNLGCGVEDWRVGDVFARSLYVFVILLYIYRKDNLVNWGVSKKEDMIGNYRVDGGISKWRE